ncbi:MAG: hypothetical protein HOO00_05445 [Rhodospirillaceae bacterium]|jgi:flagellar assembly protein FliH|nr:hypothetical protein [Rhodospirillaceae bacterium]MBT5375062.1 hypothetical protein [Rhodospirillaceae bacterium]MBT5752749.1 hypothetical protein [Rhodospirillaceae bacterium]
MSAIKKYIPPISFDENDIEKEAEEQARIELAERQHMESLIENARQEGFEQGRTKGTEDARAEGAHMASQALNNIQHQLIELGNIQASIFEESRDYAIKASLTVARKILPTLSRKNALAEIKGLMITCLDRLLAEPRILVRVNERTQGELQTHIEDISDQSGYHGKISIVANNKLDDADCRVEWADGIAERNIKEIWNEIDSIIKIYLGDQEEVLAQPDQSETAKDQLNAETQETEGSSTEAAPDELPPPETGPDDPEHLLGD